MTAKRDFGLVFMGEPEMEKIFQVLEKKADELRGHCLVFDDFECVWCGDDDPRSGLNISVPPDKGALFVNGEGRPLVMINVRLCEGCKKKVGSGSVRESQIVNKFLRSLEWTTGDEYGTEEKCTIVQPVFQSSLCH